MPQGNPHPHDLTSRKVGAFALDTSVIQSSGFSFEEGALARLANQLPPWLHLWLPDIVARETTQHRMDAVRRAVQQARGAQSDLGRILPGLEFKVLLEHERLIAQAAREFDRQLEAFLKQHVGQLLKFESPGVAVELFERYFAQRPPFGGGKDKKHEFPDAACLLILEARARQEGISVIAVSADQGWKEFAATSENIYCVSTLADLAKFFVATSENMQRFGDRLRKLLERSSLAEDILRVVRKRMSLLPWTVDAYGLGSSVDAGVVNVLPERIEIREGSLRLWATALDESACVAEVAVEVDAKLEIEAYAYQKKYKSEEKEDLASTSVVLNQGFELTVGMEFSQIGERPDPMDAVSKVFLLEKALRVEVGRIRFPGLDHRSGFDLDDDIPF